MKKQTIIKIIAVIILIGAGMVFADDWDDPGPTIMDKIVNFFFTSPGEFADKLAPRIRDNPDPATIAPLMNSYMEIMQPVFTVAIMIVGFYLIFMSGSPGGRMQAKTMFWKLLISMILISVSLEIFKMLLGISGGITARVLAGVTDGSLTFTAAETITFAIIRVFIFVPEIWVNASIHLRYLLVQVCAALFPITIFLYFFDIPIVGTIGKQTGARLWKWTISVIFAQVVQAAMLAVTVISFGNISEVPDWGNLAAVFIGIAGYMMIAIAPLMMIGFLQWLGGLLSAAGMAVSLKYPQVGYAMTAVGGMMLGQGPASSLMAAGGAAGLGYALHKGRKAASSAEQQRPTSRTRGDQTRFDDDFSS